MQLAHLLWALTLDQEQGKVMCAVAPDIEGNLKAFLCRRSPAARYASFDYCFNYFQDARDAQETVGLARRRPARAVLSPPRLLFGQLGHDAGIGRPARPQPA